MAKTKCKYGERGKSTIEFYKGDKPQRYCYGWIDAMTDETVEVCRHCSDYVDNAEKDFQEWLANENCRE